MPIRVGELEFAVNKAELRYTCVPNGTISIDLEIVGDRREGLHLTLDPPPLPGRVLTDLTGQVQSIRSPTKPDPDDPRLVTTVAGIYAGSHEDVHRSRIEWGRVDDRGIALVWTGVVNDLDTGSKPRRPLVADVVATVVEVPHPWVRWLVTRAEEDEWRLFDGIRASLLAKLNGELSARAWFTGMPFVSLELQVEVEAPGRRWPVQPRRRASEAQRVVAKVPREVVMRGDDAGLQRAIEVDIAAALDQLEKQYRRGKPRLR